MHDLNFASIPNRYHYTHRTHFTHLPSAENRNARGSVRRLSPAFCLPSPDHRVEFTIDHGGGRARRARFYTPRAAKYPTSSGTKSIRNRQFIFAHNLILRLVPRKRWAPREEDIGSSVTIDWSTSSSGRRVPTPLDRTIREVHPTNSAQDRGRRDHASYVVGGFALVLPLAAGNWLGH